MGGKSEFSKKSGKWIFRLLFVVGILLLLVNFYGLVTTLRSPYLIEDLNRITPEDITISQEEIFKVINSDQSERKIYVSNVTDAIHEGIGHYWEDEGADRYNLRIPLQENFILSLASYVMPGKFLKYEFTNYHRAIERGVGICSEHAIILSQALYDKGIKTKIVGLDGHVVVTALVDEETGEWWILDADYGVVIPHNLAAIQEDPKIVLPYYQEQGTALNLLPFLEKIYGRDGNVISNGFGLGDYVAKTAFFEDSAYILIWLIPLLMTIPFMFFSLQELRRR